MPHPFEQQPRESNKAFAAFSTYLSLGPERSLSNTAKQLGKQRTLIERWSSKFDWPGRVQAFNAHLALAERKAAEAIARANGVDWAQRQQEHREEEWKVRCELLDLARECICRYKDNLHRCGSLEGIARLLELAGKFGRLSSGLPTDRTESTLEVEGHLDIDWELALKKVYGPAPAEVVDIPATPVFTSSAAGIIHTHKQLSDSTDHAQ